VSEMLEISKHSIRAGTDGSRSTSRKASSSLSGTTVLGSDRKNFRAGRVVFFRSSSRFRREAAFSKSCRSAAFFICSLSDSFISMVCPSRNSHACRTRSAYPARVILPMHGALQFWITWSRQCR